MPAGWHALMGINTCWHRSRHMPILLCAYEKAPFPLPFQHTQGFLRASIDLCLQENMCCRHSCLAAPGVLQLRAMTESRMRANRIFVGPELVSTISHKRTASSETQQQDNTPRTLHVTLLSSYQISRISLSRGAIGHMRQARYSSKR